MSSSNDNEMFVKQEPLTQYYEGSTRGTRIKFNFNIPNWDTTNGKNNNNDDYQ